MDKRLYQKGNVCGDSWAQHCWTKSADHEHIVQKDYTIIYTSDIFNNIPNIPIIYPIEPHTMNL